MHVFPEGQPVHFNDTYLHWLWIRFYRPRSPQILFAKLKKKKNAVVSFLNPRFLSSLQQQLQTSLCIWDLHYKYPLYSSATDQANYMDKRGINSNNLYDCAFYKLLFHHCHRNIWMPANRTSNDVTNFGHGELTLSRGFSRIKTEFCLPVFHVHTSLCYY